MNIRDYKTSDLEKELTRRQKEILKVPVLKTEKWMKENIRDFAINFHKWYTSHVAEHGYEPKDYEHYIYEMLVEFCYGKEFWKWINSVIT